MTVRPPSRPIVEPGSSSPAGPSRHLALVISSLGSGGAERVLTVLAAAWIERGHRVTLFTLAGADGPVHWPLDPRVVVRPLGLQGVSRGLRDRVSKTWWRMRVVRRAIQSARPDLVISLMDTTNVLTLAATLGMRVPVVVAEHIDPHEERLDPAWAIARRLLYRRAAAITVLTERAARYFRGRVASRTHVIPNPIVLPAGGPDPAATVSPTATTDHQVVAMGRLVRQKGFDLLLDAFALVAPDRPGWRLVVHGEGPDRSALEARRDRLGLTGRATFPGVTRDPAAALAAADLFVLSSRWEGFPTVLGEAMALGRPVLAFDCPSGPSDIVRDGLDGQLVPVGDVAALTSALAGLMDDDGRRAALAARAPEVTARFGVGPIIDRWEELFAGLTGGAGDGARTRR